MFLTFLTPEQRGVLSGCLASCPVLSAANSILPEEQYHTCTFPVLSVTIFSSHQLTIIVPIRKVRKVFWYHRFPQLHCLLYQYLLYISSIGVQQCSWCSMVGSSSAVILPHTTSTCVTVAPRVRSAQVS